MSISANKLRRPVRLLRVRAAAIGGVMMATRRRRLAISSVGILIALVVWEVATGVLELVPGYLLASPSLVATTFIDLQEIILRNLWHTLFAGLLGFVLAASLAFVVAVPLTISDGARSALMPIIVGGNSVPRVTLAPLIIFYIGIGTHANLLIATWIAFFPIFINTMDGLSSLPEDASYLMASIGTSTVQEFRYFRLYYALPHIFDGMKTGISLAMIGAIVGEFVAGQQGLGNLALRGLRTLNTEMVLGVVLILGVVTMSLIFLVFLIQDRVVFWREASFFGSEG